MAKKENEPKRPVARWPCPHCEGIHLVPISDDGRGQFNCPQWPTPLTLVLTPEELRNLRAGRNFA